MKIEELVAEANDFIRAHPKPFVEFSARNVWGCVEVQLRGYHMNEPLSATYPLPFEVLVNAEDREDIYRITMERMYTNALREMFVFEGWRRGT